MKPIALPSVDELRRVFSYDPITGAVMWRVRVGSNKIGAPVTTPAITGHLRLQWKGKSIKLHRLAWKYMTGEEPLTVDHINRNALDNRWCNLRAATYSEQNYNRYIRKNSSDDYASMLRKAETEAMPLRRNYFTVSLPSREILWTMFHYDEQTGFLQYKMSSRNRKRKAGEVVRTTVKGYLKTCVGKREAYAHRIIWKMMTGDDPIVVDHINGNPLDNRWVNLRNVRQYQNLGNSKIPSTNKSGVKGVYWAKTKNKWTAQIGIGGKLRYLGRYDKLEDAKAVYEAASKQYFGLELTA